MANDKLLPLVLKVQAGERSAADALVLKIQPLIYKVALRFLFSPQDAEEAVQDILIKVITRLSSFEGNSLFSTWVYAIASHHLMDIKRRPMEQHMSLEDFSQDLKSGLTEHDKLISSEQKSPEHALLLEEIKIGCTLAMLQCLDRDARMSYILGEILELDHQEAASVFKISSSAYRKRLSRARDTVSNFMLGNCGLINPKNPCRCSKRVKTAQELGRVDAKNLIFSTSQQRAQMFPEVLVEIRKLEESNRAVALYRSQVDPEPGPLFAHWLSDLLSSGHFN
ncbi:MAG: sigma-70 family RNA polymerase sigma factor [Bermanella sp.]